MSIVRRAGLFPVALFAAPLACVGLASCAGAPPVQVALRWAVLDADIQITDVDPLVLADCRSSVMAALARHGFVPAEAPGAATPALKVEIEVVFADGVTADLSATLHDSLPPRKVLATSVAPYYEPAQVDLRSRGSRYRTMSCDVGAERLAAAMVDALGADDVKAPEQR